MKIDLKTLGAWALPWAVLLLIALGGLFIIGEGNLPWALAGEVGELEGKIRELEKLPALSQPPFQLPQVKNPSDRTASALACLEEARAQAGLTLSEVRPEPQLVEGKLVKTPFSLTAQGSVETFVDFLYLLEQDYPSLLIQRLRIGTSKEELQVELKVLDRAQLVGVREDG